jgi:hypothetical protein
MPAYEIFGRILTSDIALPELPDARNDRMGPPLAFERRLPAPPAGGWFDVWYAPDGGPGVRAARTPTGYHIRYGGAADFQIDASRRALCGDTVDCPVAVFRHWLVDQVLALAVSLDATVLHASSVALDGPLVAFAGPGRAGKSTLATALARQGHAIGSDDALLVEVRGAGVHALPAYPSVRLWRDSEDAVAAGLAGAGRPSAIGKQRFSGGLRFAREGALARIYLLDPTPAPDVRFERLTPRDAAVALLSQTYRLALDERAVLARELGTVAAIAARVGCWRLSFPRRLDRWRALAADVEAHVRETSSDVGPRPSEAIA